MQYTLTPRGDVDGLILADGTEVQVSSRESLQLVFAIRPGDVVTVHGLRAHQIPMIHAMSVTNDATHVTIATQRQRRGRDRDDVIEDQGKIKAQLHDDDGDVDGVLLEDGTTVDLPDPEAARLRSQLALGQTIYVRGTGISNALGRNIAAQFIGPDKHDASQVQGASEDDDRGHGRHGRGAHGRGGDDSDDRRSLPDCEPFIRLMWRLCVPANQNVREGSTAWARTPNVPLMRFDHVPVVDRRYWVAITLASICGCNLGDFISSPFHWNHLIGLLPLAAIFAALLYGERRSASSTEAWYWAVVIVLRAAATNLADLATHTFEWPYPTIIFGMSILQTLVVLPVTPRLRASADDAQDRPAANTWYWASLLVAGTLGTVLGDGLSEQLHLGTGIGTLLLCTLFAVIVILSYGSRWTRKASYWTAIVAVRAAGTTAGDWLAFPDDTGVGHSLDVTRQRK